LFQKVSRLIIVEIIAATFFLRLDYVLAWVSDSADDGFLGVGK